MIAPNVERLQRIETNDDHLLATLRGIRVVGDEAGDRRHDFLHAGRGLAVGLDIEIRAIDAAEQNDNHDGPWVRT